MLVQSVMVTYGESGTAAFVYSDEKGIVFLISHVQSLTERFGVFHVLGARDFGVAKVPETIVVAWGKLRINGTVYVVGERIVIEAGTQIIIEPLETLSAYNCVFGN